jgi:hypothetical protein
MAETASLLELAGLITIVGDGDDRVAYRLTADGERANRLRTMARESDVDAVLNALLGAGPRPATGRPGPARSPQGAGEPAQAQTFAMSATWRVVSSDTTS